MVASLLKFPEQPISFCAQRTLAAGGNLPRLFIAIAIPSDVADLIDRIATGLPTARWIDLHNLHLTLRFVGDVDHSTFYEIGESLAGISMAPLELELSGVMCLPPRGLVRQLSIGISANSALARLRQRVDRCVTASGAPPDRRKFVPHVTFARFNLPPADVQLAAFLRRHASVRLPPFPVTSFGLYSSVLRPKGAEHALEADYNFVTGHMARD